MINQSHSISNPKDTAMFYLPIEEDNVENLLPEDNSNVPRHQNLNELPNQLQNLSENLLPLCKDDKFLQNQLYLLQQLIPLIAQDLNAIRDQTLDPEENILVENELQTLLQESLKDLLDILFKLQTHLSIQIQLKPELQMEIEPQLQTLSEILTPFQPQDLNKRIKVLKFTNNLPDSLNLILRLSKFTPSNEVQAEITNYNTVANSILNRLNKILNRDGFSKEQKEKEANEFLAVIGANELYQQSLKVQSYAKKFYTDIIKNSNSMIPLLNCAFSTSATAVGFFFSLITVGNHPLTLLFSTHVLNNAVNFSVEMANFSKILYKSKINEDDREFMHLNLIQIGQSLKSETSKLNMLSQRSLFMIIKQNSLHTKNTNKIPL